MACQLVVFVLLFAAIVGCVAADAPAQSPSAANKFSPPSPAPKAPASTHKVAASTPNAAVPTHATTAQAPMPATATPTAVEGPEAEFSAPPAPGSEAATLAAGPIADDALLAPGPSADDDTATGLGTSLAASSLAVGAATVTAAGFFF